MIFVKRLEGFNNRIIINFGRLSPNQTITFPLAYTNKVVVSTGFEDGGSGYYARWNEIAVTPTLTTLNNYGQGLRFYYIAIGF